MKVALEDFQKEVSLKKYTTLAIGGPAKYLIEVYNLEVMRHVLFFCMSTNLPYFVLGKGSNVLFDDLGFSGLVIINRISFVEKPEENLWIVGAGYSFSLLGSQTAREGWSGLEFAAGIPGSVGGAIYMNAGANRNETCHSLESVDFMTVDGKVHHFKKEELCFNYRMSPFQKMEGVIIAGSFRLTKCLKARSRQLQIIHDRKKSQPCDAKSAGCFFRNPSSDPAGSLIEKCGLKGKKIGGAQVSPLHANFLINSGQATCQDVVSLMHFIQEEVKKQTGHQLEREVRLILNSEPKSCDV